MKKLVIVGAGGHGKVVADIAQNYYDEIVFLDDASIDKCMDYSVVGKVCDYKEHLSTADFFVAIGNPNIRKKITEILEQSRGNVVSLIHPRAVVAKEVEIGKGTVIMAGSVVNPDVRIGNGCIVNTCASVDHECVISDYVHVSVGVHIAGAVSIGDGTFVGAGATVINNVEIAPWCTIGAGAVVIHSLTDAGTYVGVPARKCGRS
jgi:sugar O-acyltransferase (sialic acid O-acetyltransferase NeuD family)